MRKYDLVVIGAGPAGLTAGIYAGRFDLKTVVLEEAMPGGQVAMTHLIENYPGVTAESGAALTERMQKQMLQFGAELSTDSVSAIEIGENGLVVVGRSERYEAGAIIVATGTGYRKLGVPGEDEFVGRGVSYCATCDGPFYKDQEIAVVGGGDSALQESLYLAGIASKVYIIHRRDEFRAVPVLAERVMNHDRIECICSHVVESVEGSFKGVERLNLKPVGDGEPRGLEVPGVFLFVGLKPKTEFLGDLIEKDDRGFLVTNDEMKTRVRGVFAAGDCRTKPLRQVATAIGDGATAAFETERFLDSDKW
ncbi:thioredoxin-disulfide reductase [bacterium]|nr:thioredoxin-disulfide reductase [bacterium]